MFLLSVGKSQIRIRNRSVLYTVLQVVLFLALSNPFFRGGYYLHPSFAQEFAVLLLRLRWGIVRLRRNWLKSFHRICPLLYMYWISCFPPDIADFVFPVYPSNRLFRVFASLWPGEFEASAISRRGFSSLWSFSFPFNLGGVFSYANFASLDHFNQPKNNSESFIFVLCQLF